MEKQQRIYLDDEDLANIEFKKYLASLPDTEIVKTGIVERTNPNQGIQALPHRIKTERKTKMLKSQAPVVVPHVVVKTIHEVLAKLRVTNCAFKVVLPNDEVVEHDPLHKLNPEKQRSRTSKGRPHGALRDHYKPYMEHMKAGDVVSIPFGEFTPNEVQSAATAWACHTWGNGSVTSSKNMETGCVEILRLK